MIESRLSTFPMKKSQVRQLALHVAAFILLAAATAIGASAQVSDDSPARDPHEVQPERPTVATHAGTVARGWLELEAGGERDRYSDGVTALTFPLNIKIGAGPRAQVNVLVSGLDGTAGKSSARGLGDIAVGLKYRLLEGAPVLTDFAILPSVKFPSASAASGLGSGTTDFGILLISSRSLGAADVDINVGATHHFGGDSSSPRLSTLWTISAGGQVIGSFGWTGELYGLPGTSGEGGAKEIVAILTGPTWQPLKWLAADAGIIEPLKGPQQKAFYAGLVWNAGKIW